MKKPLRRVTKAENPEAYRARAYTRAAPGKFRKTSKIVSRREAEKIPTRKKAEAQTKAPAPWAAKARQSRIRNRAMREYEADGTVERDSRLIKHYKQVGFEGLNDREHEEFKALFTRYPDDDVRGWLGSSEESRALRRHWKSTQTSDNFMRRAA